MELGSVCGKPFPISVLSVYEEGSSNIIDLAKKK
jgi:ribosomal protein L30E